MKLSRLLKKVASASVAVAIGTSLALPAAAAGDSYTDFDSITSHVNLNVPSSLQITRPTANISTTASNYFITGNSDPSQQLTMNGEEVATRGSRGSFGVYVGLGDGANTFVFRQGNTEKSITITKGAGGGSVSTINNIRSMAPSYDCATTSGSTIKLSCIAPAGSNVVASLNGTNVQMTPAAAAQAGVPVTYSAAMTAPGVSGTQNLGQVTYWLNGSASYQSAGSVFVNGSGALAVQVKNNATILYKDENKSGYETQAHLGAVDAVAEIGSTMYKLSTGGWVSKDSVRPLAGGVQLHNAVSGVRFEQASSGEYFYLPGTSMPFYRAYQENDKLTVHLLSSSVSGDVAKQIAAQAGNSSVFSSVDVTDNNGYVTMVFHYQNGPIWGYDIQYTDGGGLYVFAKYRPKLSGGNQPLKGVVVAVDAGHGGSDPGALGMSGTSGAMEKDITLATALAVEKRLKSLGATVIQCRSEDVDMSMNDRMTKTKDGYADFFISVHCNAVAYERDTNQVGGTEVYYYEGISGGFASALSANVAAYNGRNNRGAKLSIYRVTLNSFAPSVLLEMGFLTNPVEYDSMASKQGIYNTANAIGDTIIASLS